MENGNAYSAGRCSAHVILLSIVRDLPGLALVPYVMCQEFSISPIEADRPKICGSAKQRMPNAAKPCMGARCVAVTARFGLR
jgi:hypothetical protein